MRLILPGVDGRVNAIGFRPPVTAGLTGWWWLGGTETATEKDHAYIGNGSLAGGPTIDAGGFVSFAGYSAGDWLQTEVAETNDFTLMVVARSFDTLAAAATRPMLAGWFGSDAGYTNQGNGSCLYYGSTTGLPQGFLLGGVGHVTAGTITMDTAAFQTVPDVEAWRFLAMTFDDTSNAKVVYDKTAGTSQTNTISTTRSAHTVNRLRIGGGFSASFSGSCDVAWAGVYSTALTAQNITDTYDFVATCLSDWHAITI